MLKTNVRRKGAGTGGQGFRHDTVAPEVCEGDAAQLVLAEVGVTCP
jgi:hypothetical protein